MAKVRKPYVKCEQRRHDCFMCKDGMCYLLVDTHFNRKCPFYKTKVEVLQKGGN